MTSLGSSLDMRQGPRDFRGLRGLRIALASVVLVLLGVAAWLAWLGAFNASPFRELPAQGTRKDYAVVALSGDMGPRAGMGAPVAEMLAQHGVATVTVNSLTYFRVRRFPDEISDMLGDAIRRAMALGHTGKVVVIGQSYGADMVHVGLENLPADLRKHVSLVVLTVPTRTVFLRVSPLEWLDRTTPDAPAIDSASKLDWVPVVCIRGVEETDSLCPDLHLPRLTQVVLPGDHYLDHDAGRLFGAITTALSAHFHAAPKTTPQTASQTAPEIAR